MVSVVRMFVGQWFAECGREKMGSFCDDGIGGVVDGGGGGDCGGYGDGGGGGGCGGSGSGSGSGGCGGGCGGDGIG